MKALLYCENSKPYLVDRPNKSVPYKLMLDLRHFKKDFPVVYKALKDSCFLNGAIVAECDYEVEKLYWQEREVGYHTYYTDNLYTDNVEEMSCMSAKKLYSYLGENDGYAIHIKNVEQLDELQRLSKTPRSIHIVHFLNDKEERMYKYLLIPVKSEELCRLLNGEQTVIIRKKVLKGM